MLAQLIVSGVAVGCVYALIALGMTILFRSTTVVNFCHGEFFMLGAFAVLVPLQTLGWGYGWSILFSLCLLFIVGMAVERGLMRPLQHAPHISLAMMTVALSYLFKGVARFFYGREVVALPPLLTGDPVFFGEVVLTPQDMLIMGVVLVVVVASWLFFQKTEIGKVVEAASETPRGASLSGINVPLLRNLMWGAGATMGALAGILIAPNTLVYPDMGGHMLVRGFAAMTLGGFGSLPGAVVGGIALGVVENLAGGYVSSALVEITAYVVIIIVLLIRPQGLLGNWRRARV
ncbi:MULTISPECIES: branched-chain amino acid ABC transporter permease [unclassified Achromobacter]|uniref:branched-chain amino acid ABC transporter permease n=1 Tax=unclassified Achromobacter TaxID=2626865 RepID=UPI000B51A82D|nr:MULTISPECIES: branched-chain amino acid ABC transporter permease [unclassified Achromobacter]OWT80396.1 branched-chain amino acid ABC transporter permease [Achromobacter sp. HZ34]OWT82279.1 branched-chain amino acid ABC transporter permease [Achromobacter sp. HZ28]